MHTDMQTRPVDVEDAAREAPDAPPTGERLDADSPFGAGDRGRPAWVRRAVYAGIVLLALLVAYLLTRRSEQPAAAAGHNHGATPAADSARPVMLAAEEARRIGVTYGAATIGPLAKEIRTVGQVTFDETRVKAVAPKIDGWVERLDVDYTGQLVQAGAPLLAVYSPMLVQAQEELLLAGHLRSDVADGSEEARGSADDLLSSARRRLAYWDIPAADVARIERSGQVQRTLTLRAPVSGFVIEKNVLAGQKIMAGETLYRIADLGTVWVEGEVFEQDLPSVQLGQRVAIELQALPDRTFSGRVSFVYPTMNEETRTARVRVALPNPGLQLKPGMYATIRLTGAARSTVLSVPRSAVLATGERNLVFVKRSDGMLEPRLVVPGVSTDERTEILSGLSAGDTVVASATFLVDAESNLGTALGGMGNMPGMDMTAPTGDRPRSLPVAPRGGAAPATSPRPSPRPASGAPTSSMPGMDHSGHTMPEE